MNSLDSKNKIRNYLKETTNVNNIDDKEDLFAKGIVKSLAAMQLVIFIENTFKIKVENHELDLDNFCSIEEMVKFVESKKQVAQ